VGQSKAKQILGRQTELVYVGIMGMTRAVWVGQERVWVGHSLPGLIVGTASDAHRSFQAEARNHVTRGEASECIKAASRPRSHPGLWHTDFNNVALMFFINFYNLAQADY